MKTIDFGWDNAEQTIVRLTLRDHWTWADFYSINNEVAALMRSSDQSLHLLLDYSQTRTVPLGGVITHLRNVLEAYPANCALTVVVTRNMLVQRLISIFKTTYQADLGKRVLLATTLDDAYHLIEGHANPRSAAL